MPVAGAPYSQSAGEFPAWFGTGEDCLDCLQWLRWPEGFTCPSCGYAGGWRRPRLAGLQADLPVPAWPRAFDQDWNDYHPVGQSGEQLHRRGMSQLPKRNAGPFLYSQRVAAMSAMDSGP
jgi:hypothetical protein